MQCLFQRWVFQVEKQDTWRHSRGPEYRVPLARPQVWGCLFCIRFKQTHNDKPLRSSPLSPSRLVGVSHSPLCSSCLTTYNYVVGATGMEPCRRKKKKGHRRRKGPGHAEISLQGLRVKKLQAINLTHEGI